MKNKILIIFIICFALCKASAFAATLETSAVEIKGVILDAMADMASGSYEAAIPKFDKAIIMDPNIAEVYMLRGQCYEQLKNFPSAISNFVKARELDPDNWAADYELGICYFLNDEAYMTVWEELKLISLNKCTPEAHAYLAYSYYRKKDYGKAWEELKKAQELGADVEPIFIEMLKTDSGGEPKKFILF